MVTARYDVRLMATAVLCAAAAMLLYGTPINGVALAALPFFVLVVTFGWAGLANLRAQTVVIGLAALVVLLDESYNNPFYEGYPPSEWFGPLMFDRWQSLFEWEGAQINTFEVLSLALGLIFVVRRGFRRLVIQKEPLRHLMYMMVAALPVTAALAVMLGLARGNSLEIALTQNRFLPVLPVWLYIGYCAYSCADDAILMFKILTGITVFKCLEAWYVFAFDFGFKLGTREYVMEHVTSEAIAMSLMFIAYMWWHRRRHVLDDLLAVGLVLVMVGPYLLNLRRTSFLGLGFTLALLPLFYRRAVKAKYLVMAGGCIAAGILAVSLTWNLPGPLGALSYPVKRFVNPPPPGEFDYRDVENYNHYRSIMDQPIAGRGFGVTLARYIPLLDISTVYPLYEIVPHNNILFIWANAGPLGMGAFAAVAAIGFGICLRLSRVGVDWQARLLGFMGWGMVLRWLVYCWADLGLAFVRLPAIAGLVVGMALRALGTTPKEDLNHV